MAYLDRHFNSFRFQIAIPADLHHRIGKSPIRIPLGNTPASIARRAARLLSGHAERPFIAARSSGNATMDMDPRDIIIAELTAQIDALVEGFEQYKDAAEQVRQSAVTATRLEAENPHLREMGQVGAFVDSIADGMQILESKVRTLPKKAQVDTVDALAAVHRQMAALSQKAQLALDGGPPRKQIHLL